MLARQGVLDVAQHGLRGRGRPGAHQPGARLRNALVERFQPALRFLLEIVDGAHATPSFRNRLSSAYSGRKKVRSWRTRWVGDGLPCRGQEAPQSALREE